MGKQKNGLIDPYTGRNYVPDDFDTLACVECEKPVKPKSVSAGPIVAYQCKSCGTSWRINRDGDIIHLRHKITKFSVLV